MSDRRVGATAIILAAVAIAGCGTSDDDKAKSTAQTFIDALADGNAENGCGVVNKQGVAWLKLSAATDPASSQGFALATSCPAAFNLLARKDGASGLATADIKKVRVRGDQALVVTDSSFLPGLRLVKDGGGWKVADGYSE
jgi:hypothetical protein